MGIYARVSRNTVIQIDLRDIKFPRQLFEWM